MLTLMLSLRRLNPVDQRSYIAKRKEDARVPTILFCEIKVRVIETNLSLKIKHLYLLANKQVIAVDRYLISDIHQYINAYRRSNSRGKTVPSLDGWGHCQLGQGER
jgi:hypothetical protein